LFFWFIDRYFTKSHEWIEVEGSVGTVGITDHAQKALGDIVFVDLPAKGAKYEKEGNLAAVESVKASAVVYAPVGGSV
jgi:glycine cleavage system H protein